MNRRMVLASLGLVLTLLTSACSRVPETLQAPHLEPQFGTSRRDRADVVVNDPQRGHIYVAGVASADPLGSFRAGVLYLRRYEENGSLAWERRTQVSSEPGASASAKAVKLDAAGNVYLAWWRYLDDYEGRVPSRDAYLVKRNRAGKLLYQIWIDNNISDLEVDAAGNVYLAGSRTDENPVGADERFYLRKYDPQGRVVWERLRSYDSEGELENPTQAIPRPDDIGLGGDGSIYVAGQNSSSCCDEGSRPFWTLSKYSNAGLTLWEQERPQGGAVLTVAGRSFYLATNTSSQTYGNTLLLQRYTSSGLVLWEKTISGSLATSLAADTSGNAYLAGYSAVGSEIDRFARKYTASGTLSWRYQPRLVGTREVALGISAKDGRNVYLAGTTNGKVNGRNFGGYDAFLLRLDAEGKRIWAR